MDLVPSLQEVTAGGLRLITDPEARRAGVLVAFTDRHGRVDGGPAALPGRADPAGDDPGGAAAGRRRVAHALGVDVRDLRFARQVHGARCADAGLGAPAAEPTADALVVRSPGPVACVLTADCVPIVVAGPDGVAAVHAGWRGLVAGVVANAVAAVGAGAGTGAAWIGPSIRSCCYEVGPEVVEAFGAAGLPVAGPRRVDPGAAAQAALRSAGIARVAATGRCTSCDDRFFSYRREGVTGRQGGFAALVEGSP